MVVGEWIALAGLMCTILGGLGYIIHTLNSKIDAAEKSSKRYAVTLIERMWDKAEEHFATKADLGRLEGKIDAILVHIQYLRDKHERDD